MWLSGILWRLVQSLSWECCAWFVSWCVYLYLSDLLTSGERCEVVGSCVSMPCQNNATCEQDGDSGYNCTCQSGISEFENIFLCMLPYTSCGNSNNEISTHNLLILFGTLFSSKWMNHEALGPYNGLCSTIIFVNSRNLSGCLLDKFSVCCRNEKTRKIEANAS